jgi:hypothetical protein
MIIYLMAVALIGGLWLAGILAAIGLLFLLAPVVLFVLKVVVKLLMLVVAGLLALCRIRI